MTEQNGNDLPQPAALAKPYVGPNPIRNKETFYGRDRETAELIIRLKANHTVLLYSPSGAGKTSLIHAGLIPGLAGQDYCILPTIRLNRQPEPGQLPNEASQNRYLLSALISLDEGLAEHDQAELSELAAANLADYLKAHQVMFAEHSGNPAARRFLLIFDQFEEILTIDPADKTIKETFFGELLNVLYDNRYWAVFAMREDYLARLEPYLSYFPDRLSAHFRLEFLEPPEALQAIQNPVKTFGTTFQDDAANQLVTDLRQVYILNSQGKIGKEAGPFVEPVQLQVVCSNLWEAPRPDPSLITLADVQQWGNVDNALATYYCDRISDTVAVAGIAERGLREWIGTKLITAQGLRNQVLSGADPEFGVTEAVIDRLVNAYLVREDQRRGATWLELAHDRLVEPIRRNNAEWFDKNLSLLQRQAVLWEREGRPDHLLLRDKALVEAEEWAAPGVTLTKTESALLDESRDLRTRLEKDRQAEIKLRAAERQRRLAILASAMALLAIVMMLAAGYLWRDAVNSNTKLRNANAAAIAATETHFAALGLAPIQDTAMAATLQSNLAATAQRSAETETARAVQKGQVAQVATEIAQIAQPSPLPTPLPGTPLIPVTGGGGGANFVEPFLAAAGKLKNYQPDLALLLAAIAYQGSEDDPAVGETVQAMVNELSQSDRSLGEPIAEMASPIVGLLSDPDGNTLSVSAASGDITALDDSQQFLGTICGIPVGSQNNFYGPDGQAFALVGPAAEGVSIFWSETDSIDWEKLAPLGIRFAVLRVSPTILEGANAIGEANTFPWNWNQMLSNDFQDLIRGAYWVFDPGQDPVQQVQQFYTLISNQPRLISGYGEIGDLPLILQISQSGGLSRDELAANVKAALDWLETTTGKTPIIYTTPGFWDGAMLDADGHAPDWTAHYPLWVRDVSSPNQPRLPTGWSAWTFWDYQQCSGGCTLPTIDSTTTYFKSRFNGTLGQLEDFAGKPTTDLALKDNFVYLWDVEEAQPLRKIGLIPEYITSLVGNQDGSLLVTGRHGGSIDAWNLPDLLASGGPQVIAAGRDHNIGDQAPAQQDNPVMTLILSPDDHWLFSTDDTKKGWLWDVPSQNYIGTVLSCAGSQAFYTAVFDPSSRWLAATTGGNEACLWDTRQVNANTTSLNASFILKGHSQPVQAIAFSTDGKFLATGGLDRTLLLYQMDALDQDPIALKAPPGGVSSIAFGPNENLAAGGQNGLIYLWRKSTPKDTAQPLYGHAAQVSRLEFSPSGEDLYSGGQDGQVIWWDLSLDTPDLQACKLAGRNPTVEELASFGMDQAEIDQYTSICSDVLR
jgi:WD40 repeat protein